MTHFKREIQIWKTLRFVNVIQLYGVCVFQGRPCMVMELCEQSLSDLLRKCQGHHNALPWKTRVQIAHHVACGVKYLHSTGTVHRDLKAMNVLLTKDG